LDDFIALKRVPIIGALLLYGNVGIALELALRPIGPFMNYAKGNLDALPNGNAVREPCIQNNDFQVRTLKQQTKACGEILIGFGRQ
jgi:hypothetical protein